jgi:hypothetical protein
LYRTDSIEITDFSGMNQIQALPYLPYLLTGDNLNMYLLK